MATSTPAAAIRWAETPADIATARELFVEYARWLNVDLCFQGFHAELATLPGAYAPPRGRLLLAGAPEQTFGCIALRPLDAVPRSASAKTGRSASVETTKSVAGRIGEVKRLFVQPTHRGGGWGRSLADALIAEARTIGYTELKLDTLERMGDARRLYANLGFRECAAYYDNPLPDVVYMALVL